MNLKDILSISGYSGLYKFISQGRNGVIVESLIDKSRMNASSSLRISALEDIAIFTEEKEVPLKEVFQIIFKKENGGPAIDSKLPNDKLKAYFTEILPNYEKEKVYVSDMKKLFSWYNLLNGLQMIDLTVEEEQEDKSEEKTEDKKE